MDDTDAEPQGETSPDPAEALADEARASHSLKDRLKGVVHRTGKVLLYTNLPAVDAYAEISDERQPVAAHLEKLREAAANPKTKTDHSTEIAETEDKLAEIDERWTEARAVMNESGMVVHLVGYPTIALKVAKRDARKKFGDEAIGGDIPQGRIEEAQEFMDLQLLGASIARISDVATRADIELGARTELGQTLSDDLPPSQFSRLQATWRIVTTQDRIVQDAVDDPGF